MIRLALATFALLAAGALTAAPEARQEDLIKDDGNIDILGGFHGALDITRYQL